MKKPAVLLAVVAMSLLASCSASGGSDPLAKDGTSTTAVSQSDGDNPLTKLLPDMDLAGVGFSEVAPSLINQGPSSEGNPLRDARLLKDCEPVAILLSSINGEGAASRAAVGPDGGYAEVSVRTDGPLTDQDTTTDLTDKINDCKTTRYDDNGSTVTSKAVAISRKGAERPRYGNGPVIQIGVIQTVTTGKDIVTYDSVATVFNQKSYTAFMSWSSRVTIDTITASRTKRFDGSQALINFLDAKMKAA